MNNQRKIVYEMADGTTESFPLHSPKEEQDESAQAAREISSKGTYVVGYHFEGKMKRRKRLSER